MIILRSASAAETEALGESLGRSLPHGMILGLTGKQGVGKTVFARGVARGLGYTEEPPSPADAVLKIYEGGRLNLFHLNLHSLDSPDKIRAAGLENYLTAPDGISVVEWIENWRGDAQAEDGGCLYRIYFHALDETTREIGYDIAGA